MDFVVLVRPTARAYPALDIDLCPFADIFVYNFGVAAPGGDIMPLRVFLEIAVTVTIAFIGGKAQRCHFHAVLGRSALQISDFRIGSDIAD